MSSRLTAAIALTTAVAYTSAGCASRTWPTTYAAAANPAFASQSLPIRSVDILPIDVDVWPEEARTGEAESVHRRGSAVAMAAIAAGLRARGYRVGSRIDWYGRASRPDAGPAQVMSPAGVGATVGALASYGAAAARSPGLPVPYLPVRLGEATGSDATLYLGGWSYLGHPDDDDAAITALVIVLVAAVAITAVVVSKGGGGGKSGGGGHGGPSEPHSSPPSPPAGGGGSRWGGAARHGGGGLGSLAGRAVGAVGRATIATGRLALEVAAKSTELALDVGVATARATGHVANATLRGAYIDVGGPHTHVDVLGPDYSPCNGMAPRCPTTVSWWRSPPTTGESEMYLEMTLVDNHSGGVLWHARQLFPAEGASARDVKRAVDGLLSTLPRAP